MTKLPRLNYILIIILFANLVFITIAVYLYPKVWIFQITSTIAWIFSIGQLIVGHKLNKK